MTSQSEHTNRQRSPQQAQGRKWPILVLPLGLVALVLVLTACGGSSSTSAPDATTSRLRKKGVSVKLPCRWSQEHDDVRP